MAEMADTKNSGAEVPGATTVSPMIIGDILKFLDEATEPITNWSALVNSTRKPTSSAAL